MISYQHQCSICDPDAGVSERVCREAPRSWCHHRHDFTPVCSNTHTPPAWHQCCSSVLESLWRRREERVVGRVLVCVCVCEESRSTSTCLGLVPEAQTCLCMCVSAWGQSLSLHQLIRLSAGSLPWVTHTLYSETHISHKHCSLQRDPQQCHHTLIFSLIYYILTLTFM